MTVSTLASASPKEPVRDLSSTSQRGSPNFFRAWTSSFLVYFFPTIAGRLWVGISLFRALLVALLNFALAPLWIVLVVASYEALDLHLLRTSITGDYVPQRFRVFATLFESIPGQLYGAWLKSAEYATFAQVFIICAILLIILTGFAILFFVLLPLAARPGRNKSCVRHTLRAVLLSTGWIHVWSPIIAAMFMLLIVNRVIPNLEFYILPVTIVLSILTLWTLASLIAAVRIDYRTAADLPKPHDPWCEECGYNLLAADADGRCPECGTPVQQSMGPTIRPPTPWETEPTLFNFAAIRDQLTQLFRRPRQLFFSMPTLQGQSAAHRWLLGSVTAVGLLASFILPVGNLLNIFEIEWGWNIVFGSLSVGIVWAILAIMMVGIETAGIATFSRLRARSNPDPAGPGGVALATAAKVTAYSSALMLPWVLLGGAQLLVWEYVSAPGFLFHHHISLRTLQIILASTLSLAHIGGLLWYELTVYRGIRAIQYANK